VYQTVKSGKDNAPVFEATVTAMGQNAFGSGGNKKEAEQQAAKMLLDKLGNITRTPI
jgi:dsRNA-specific ribonuclease